MPCPLGEQTDLGFEKLSRRKRVEAMEKEFSWEKKPCSRSFVESTVTAANAKDN